MQEELKYRTYKVLGYNSDLELLRHYIYNKLTTEDGVIDYSGWTISSHHG